MEFDTLLTLVGDEPLFETALLLAGSVDPGMIRVQLSRWVRAGKILQVRRGLYAIAPPYQKRQPHPFLVANHLQKASYVSLQSALAYYSLIPEVVNTITSVSTGRPERLQTPLGTYDFRHIKTAFLFGYRLTDLGDQSAFVASPEKALLDLVYLQPGGESIAFIRELRLQNTEILDQDLLTKLADRFDKEKMQTALKNILQVISGETEEYDDL